ncbi:serine/threonine protein kinase [Polytolypa hystricis UAMH7299]|uniref:Serine/threonine protein kinase n=1 Tax=Polytolypa hystricis (strain UAMH7299) TaxID=1447883 RepID=A0A2B7YPD4_POLH7|nr:serine/threonine protein kinase [Polytolypa hystricis UAMH7299]
MSLTLHKHRVVFKNLNFDRELDPHRVPAIASSPYIRQLLDVIDPEEGAQQGHRRMVFEWMDTDLWKARPYVFQSLNAVHTDINPNNILLSNLDQPTPTVKVSDLDQGNLETRAPEVWYGLGVWPTSDVWSLGVTLVHWLMSKSIFGPRGKIIKDHTNAWCMAKLMRPVGRFEMSKSMDNYDEWLLAVGLEGTEYRNPEIGSMKPYITLGILKEELGQLPRDLCSLECIDFLVYLLNLDYKKRPTTLDALKHPFVKPAR